MFINFKPFTVWYGHYLSLLAHMQSVFLLVIRMYWGWQFFQAGFGKFMNFEKVVGFFASLNIPMPAINAVMAAGTEMVGGLLLLAGLGSRLITVPLIFTMAVAYFTAHNAELLGLFSDPDKFFGAAPFLYLYACVIVLLFGPGKISLDALAGRFIKKDLNKVL